MKKLITIVSVLSVTTAVYAHHHNTAAVAYAVGAGLNLAANVVAAQTAPVVVTTPVVTAPTVVTTPVVTYGVSPSTAYHIYPGSSGVYVGRPPIYGGYSSCAPIYHSHWTHPGPCFRPTRHIYPGSHGGPRHGGPRSGGFRRR